MTQPGNEDKTNLSMIAPLNTADYTVWIPKSRTKFKKVDPVLFNIQSPLGFVPIIDHIRHLCIYNLLL